MAGTAWARSELGRRAFLRSGGVALGSAVLASPLAGLQARQQAGGRPQPGNGYGPLQPVVDRTTGLPLLRLPEGFSYQSFGWTGDLMDDGTLTPDRHDGMAVVDVGGRPGRGGELVLIRNHERGPCRPAPHCRWSGRARLPSTTRSRCRECSTGSVAAPRP